MREFLTTSPRTACRSTSAGCIAAGRTSPKAVVDGNPKTRWSSQFADPQWIAIDLGKETKFSRVTLLWEAAYAVAYTIEISRDGKTWKAVYTTDKGDGRTDEITFPPTAARWVRMSGTKRGTQYGYSLWEFKVFP